MHCHGYYKRYARPSGTERFRVPRFLCCDCGRTTSVLPTDRLPYRPLEGSRLQRYFDTQVGWASGLDPPAKVAEAGCLQRAWQRWQERAQRLHDLFGQILPATLTTAAQVWQALRQAMGSIEQMLLWLARYTHSSLLGDYRCLQPASPTVWSI